METVVVLEELGVLELQPEEVCGAGFGVGGVDVPSEAVIHLLDLLEPGL